MSGKMVSRDAAQLFCGQSQRLVVPSQAAQCLDLCVDGNRRVCSPASFAGNFDCLIEWAEGLLELVLIDQTHPVHARVSDVSTRIERFCNRPGLHYIPFSRRDVTE
jgi:hypothetical protein